MDDLTPQGFLPAISAFTPMKIGILALQGGYEAHGRMLQQLGVTPSYIRTVAELDHVDALILPGGESSVALKLLQGNDLFDAIRSRAQAGMPCFGTCAGAILLAKTVLSPSQISLGLMDTTVERNSYGRQLDSRIVHGHCTLKSEPLEMFFIRAPRFVDLAPTVTVIADYEGEPVCVAQGRYLAASFHPELTHDTTLHRYFLEQVSC